VQKNQKNHLFNYKLMNLSNLRPAKGSVRERKRVGRGQGSGMGGTSTRGHKGAQSRSGYSRKMHFEGGQMPLQRRVPKFGFKNINRVEYKPLNLDSIQTLVDETKVTVINLDFLLQHGLVSKKDLVKILSRGEITTAVEIHAHAFSASAKEAIEKAGGKAIVPTKVANEEAAN
jgi:large subunit ribosomal protein L15